MPGIVRTVQGMPTKTGRWEIRCTDDLKARVIEEAGRRGQTLTAFMERALEASLAGASEAGSSEAEGALLSEQSGPAPVPRAKPQKGTAARGVRPAAQPRTQPGRVHSQRCTCAVCKPPKGK